MQVKTRELKGSDLDYAVSLCEDVTFSPLRSSRHYYAPSTNWVHGGPLIERNGISVIRPENKDGKPVWAAVQGYSKAIEGPTPLIAAMRCLVYAKLGDKVEMPEELR